MSYPNNCVNQYSYFGVMNTAEKNAFVKLINTLTLDSNIIKLSPNLTSFLQSQGLKGRYIDQNNIKPFFGMVFEDLGIKSSRWNLSVEDLMKSIDVLPENWRKEMVSDDVILFRLPESKWGQYRDASWVKNHSKTLHADHTQLTSNTHLKIDQEESKPGYIKYSVVIELGDLSKLKEAIEKEARLRVRSDQGEDFESEVLDLWDDMFGKPLEQNLDKKLWDDIRHENSAYTGLSVEIFDKPSIDEYKNAKVTIEVTVYSETPSIGTKMEKSILNVLEWMAP